MKILIIEDEEAAARRLQKMLLRIAPQSEVLQVLESIEGTLNWLAAHPSPDLILMDIHLADGASFELFRLGQVEAPVIFITAYDQYALQAFRVHAIDYLLKPVKEAELSEALQRYEHQQKKAAPDWAALLESVQGGSPGKRFLIRIGQQLKVVDLEDGAYFYTENKSTFMMSKEGKRYPLELSLDKLEEMLDPRRYFRANRQVIFAMEAIAEMYAVSKSRVKVALEPEPTFEVVVSTERSPGFKKWLTGEA